MSDKLEIKIQATRLTPETFLDAARSFFEIVEGVASNLGYHDIPWSVGVKSGSAVIEILSTRPTPQVSITIDAVSFGVRSLRSGVRMMPPGFTRREITASRKLATLVSANSVQSISIKNGGDYENLPATVVSVADSILSRERNTAFGSIEGKIDSLSDRQGFSCSIFDPLLRREIVCHFQKAEIQEEAIQAFRKRVLVSGLIRYAKEGYPVNMVVDSVRVFPDESELPAIEDIQALFK